MIESHPIRYIVRAQRHGELVHIQEATSLEDAERIKARFDSLRDTNGEIDLVHDPAETDLTAHTRELLEDLASASRRASHR